MTQLLVLFCIIMTFFTGCNNSNSTKNEFRQQGAVPGEKQTIVIGDTPYTFCWCPPGKFIMGDPSVTKYSVYKDEFPHEVELTNGFWMLESEVTQKLWENIMNYNPSYFKGVLFNHPKRPVDSISWNDCQSFINNLNQSVTLPGKYYFRLPTEAEWEYACRAGKIHNTEDVKKMACCDGSDGASIGDRDWLFGGTPSKNVKTRKSNDWNIYDMYGNVAEFCLDMYDKNAYTTLAGINPYTCGNNKEQNKYPVIRGRHITFSKNGLFPYARIGSDEKGMNYKNNRTGFRIVISNYTPVQNYKKQMMGTNNTLTSVHKDISENTNTKCIAIPTITEREWTIDSSSQIKRIRGTYVRSDSQFVEIKQTGGKILKFDMRYLSSMDCEYINQIEKKEPLYTTDSHTPSVSGTPPRSSQKNNTHADSDSKQPIEKKSPVSSVSAADGNYPVGAGTYFDSMIQENVYIGDRSAEKSFVPTASPVAWTVGINERSDFKMEKPLEPISVFNDPRLPAAAQGNKSEHLFFSDSRNNRLFYSYQVVASDNSKELTNYVEFHDLESDTHMLYETSVQAAVEGVLPEKNWLFGLRHRRPGERMMPIPVVSFFRMTEGGQLETIFQFSPYRQEDPTKEKDDSKTKSMPRSGSRRTMSAIEKIVAVDSSHFITGNHSILTLWNVEQLRSVYSIYCDSLLTDLSDDGTWLAVPVNSNPSQTDGIEIREALTGDIRGVIGGRKSGVFACRFSPSGKHLAVLYRNELVVYSLKDGNVSYSINCPDGSFSTNRLMWTSETKIMNNGILYDLQKGSILCHYLTLDSRTEAMTFHQGKVWIVFRSPDGFKLVNVELPHKEVEEAFQKIDFDKMFFFHPEMPLKLTVMINAESSAKRFPTLVSEWEKRLKQKGFNISQEANATLMVNLRLARQEEIAEQFQKMEPHTTKSDYLLMEAMLQVKALEGSNVSFKSVWDFRHVYQEQNWQKRLLFQYGQKTNTEKEKKTFAYIDWLSVPRYIGKDQKGTATAPLQVMYDEKGINILSPGSSYNGGDE